MVRTLLRRLAMAALVGCAAAAPADAATACDSLTTLALGNGKVISTQAVARAAFVPPAGPATGAVQTLYARLPEFCRVRRTLTPSSDSDIKVEVWLPASGWNGKFQAVGNGGLAGAIPYPAMARRWRTATRPPAPTRATSATTPTSCRAIPRSWWTSPTARCTRWRWRPRRSSTRTTEARRSARISTAARRAAARASPARSAIPADFDGIVAGAPRGTRCACTPRAVGQPRHEPDARERHSRRASTR